MAVRCRAALASAALMLAAVGPAAAEVMDKEPTVHAIWAGVPLAAVIAFVAGRVHPALGVVVLLFVPSTASNMLWDLVDSSVGPAIMGEAGWPYLLHVLGANAVPVAAFLCGALLWRRALNRKSARPA